MPHNDRCTFAGEEGHFTCGCGDCACGGWDGGHQCGPYSCRCEENASSSRGEGVHRLLESLINVLIATENFRASYSYYPVGFQRDIARREINAAKMAVEAITGREWSDIREAVLAERKGPLV